MSASRLSPNFLRVLVDPEEPDVDIVAIHGLNPKNTEFHAEATWSSGDKLWLRDFLPTQLPNARILLFGYNSNIAFETSIAGVREHAANLLNRLASKRIGAEDRPILFVAHSLGGIIVKRALVEAKLDDSYKAIRDATYGIAFFGTPHQGGNFANLGDIAASIVRGILRNPKNTFMEALRKDSLFSDTLVDDFRHQLEDYHILSFYETLPMGKLGLIVDKKSATLGVSGARETQIPLDADHRGMCKFGSADEDNYEQVSFALARLVKFAVETTAKKDSLASLNAKLLNSRIEPTFILPYARNPDFVGRGEILAQLHRELCINEEHQQRAALWGLGGVGKSQIAIEYAYWHRRSHPESLVFWVHASSFDRFSQSFCEIAQECKIPGAEDPKANYLALMKTWLSSTRNGTWLMIMDNADDVEMIFGADAATVNSIAVKASLIREFIPECSHGAILVTTRSKIVGQKLTRGRSLIKVSPMNETESAELFSQQLKNESLEVDEVKELTKELEGLPLALAQAAAFMQMNSLTFLEYHELYKRDDEIKTKLLSEHFEAPGRDLEIPNPVTATFSISFEHIKHAAPYAANILSLMALLDRQVIPKSLIQKQALDEIELTKALGILKAFSLITADDANNTFDVHRLVHLAARRWLKLSNEFDIWAISCLKMMIESFPSGEYGTLDVCDLYLPHAKAALSYMYLFSANDATPADLVGQMASFLYNRGNYKLAGTLAERALDLRERILGEEHPDTLKSMNDLASTLYSQGSYVEAEKLYHQTLELRGKILGEEHPDTLKSMGNLAIVLHSLGKYVEAEKLDHQTLELRGKILGEEHPDTLTSMNNLAIVLHSLGKHVAAENLYRQTLELRGKVLGEEHPDTLTSMNNLAIVLHSLGKDVAAENLYRQTLELRGKVLGEEHPKILNSIYNLAALLQNSKRYDESHLLYQRVLTSYQEKLGPDHPDTLLCSKGYSLLLDKMKLASAGDASSSQISTRAAPVAETPKHFEDSINRLSPSSNP